MKAFQCLKSSVECTLQYTTVLLGRLRTLRFAGGAGLSADRLPFTDAHAAELSTKKVVTLQIH